MAAVFATSMGAATAVPTPTPPNLVSIAVTPANPSVPAGQTEQFTATGTYSDTSTQDVTSQVTWSSGTPSVATINSSGLATALASGNSSIGAALGGISGSTVLNVTSPVLESIAVTPANPSVPVGLTKQFTATGTYSDGSTQDLTSQVSWGSATASVATISTSGLATAVGAGTSSISATLGGVTGSTVLTGTTATLVSIAVTPAAPSVPAGLTEQFAATGTYSDGSLKDLTSQVTWASGTPAKASVNAAGLATGLASGTSSIGAALGGISGSTVLNVTSPVLESIAVTPANPSVPVGLTEQFTATGTYSDSSTQDLTSQVTWSSGTPAVASISAAGLATTLGTGTSSIGATLGGVTGSTVLTGTPGSPPAPTLKSIAVTPANPSIAAGTTRQLKATGKYSDGTTRDVTQLATWSSSGSALKVSNAAGTKGLAQGLAIGTANAIARLNGISGQTRVTVTAAVLRQIVVEPSSFRLRVGKTGQLAAEGIYSDGSTRNLTRNVTWTSSAPAVASVSNAAGTMGQVKAHHPGSARIVASFNGVRGGSTVTVPSA